MKHYYQEEKSGLTVTVTEIVMVREREREEAESMTGSRKYDSHSRFNSRKGYDITL
jgi:hypothetical protein